jgi:hypothetical protein
MVFPKHQMTKWPLAAVIGITTRIAIAFIMTAIATISTTTATRIDEGKNDSRTALKFHGIHREPAVRLRGF